MRGSNTTRQSTHNVQKWHRVASRGGKVATQRGVRREQRRAQGDVEARSRIGREAPSSQAYKYKIRDKAVQRKASEDEFHRGGRPPYVAAKFKREHKASARMRSSQGKTKVDMKLQVWVCQLGASRVGPSQPLRKVGKSMASKHVANVAKSNARPGKRGSSNQAASFHYRDRVRRGRLRARRAKEEAEQRGKPKQRRKEYV